MRSAYSSQGRFDCILIEDLELNLNCRDEIVPILEGLKYAFGQRELRDELIRLVAQDVNESTRTDIGREGFDYWQIVVLAVVRLGCNFDYDRLQDLCENHRALRCLLRVGDWEDESFAARRIRDTLCLLKPVTIEQLNHVIVAHGQQLHGTAAYQVRGDSFVVETNIHYPSESSLIGDGLRKLIPICVELADLVDVPGWRQAKHLVRKTKRLVREIGRIAASDSPKVKATMNSAYAELLDHALIVLERAKALATSVMVDHCGKDAPSEIATLLSRLTEWRDLTVRVCDTAYRRTQLDEKVANSEKLFSLFEVHTQLYRRGKAGEPNQFGRSVLVFEDGAGFISHYHLMARDAVDELVACEQLRITQQRHGGQIREASLDRGFYSEENAKTLQQIVAEPCLPPRHRNDYAKCMAKASVTFRRLRQRHSGVESAIGALQSGNGLKRCRDKSELGFERYVGLAILGRNFQVLGKLLISRRTSNTPAGATKRQAA